MDWNGWLEQDITLNSESSIVTMNVNRRRNYYNYEGFGYLVRHCKSWKIVRQERRIEYGDNLNSVYNSKVEGDQNLN